MGRRPSVLAFGTTMYQHLWYVDVPDAGVLIVSPILRSWDVDTSTTHVSYAIVGAGFSGLGAAIRLKQEGLHDFIVLERASDVGGVWRDNSYPGAACDVESHLYSFSFAPNPRWSFMFSRQPEILDYLRRCAHDFGILPHVRFGHGVLDARWDEARELWQIETTQGRFTANVLIAAMGGLSEPAIPKLPGLSTFEGKVFHSARWDHQLDLRGRKVAVVGTGASAVQFVPAIQPEVRKLTLFQRTPAWVIPRFDRPISSEEQARLARHPSLQQLRRAAIYARRELFVLGFRNPRVMKLVERYARSYLERTVHDPVLRAKLTPDFRIGCKRILITRDYLPALTRSNVEVVAHGLSEVRPHSVIAADGSEHEVDTIIFGTGFQVADMPFGHHVRGLGGKTLHEAWRGTPEAHRATTVAGFPNLFMLLGPQTGLGHTSVLLMLESQLALLLEALRYMRREQVDVVEPRAEAQASFIAEVQQKTQDTVWVAGGCASYYLNDQGTNFALWPSFTFSFRKRAHFYPGEYHLSRRSPGTSREPSLRDAAE